MKLLLMLLILSLPTVLTACRVKYQVIREPYPCMSDQTPEPGHWEFSVHSSKPGFLEHDRKSSESLALYLVETQNFYDKYRILCRGEKND